MNARDLLRAIGLGRPPSAPPPPAANSAGLGASALRARLARVPNEQLSREAAGWGGALGLLEEQLAGYPNDSRRRLIAVLRGLAQSDDDVGGTLRDYVALCGAGFALDFLGGARAIKAAETELQAWGGSIYPEGGGWSGLVANQVGELLLGGASSCEWFPERNRRGVAGVAVVPAEEVRLRRDDSGALLHEQLGGAGGATPLHPRTYLYAAAQTAGRSPYGVPLFLSALEALSRKRDLLVGEQRVINLMARAALVQANVPPPTPKELGFASEADAGYMEALAAYYGEVADLIVAGKDSGLYVAPSDTTITVLPLNQTAQGVPQVTAGNQRRVWSALGTLPFLRGQMEHTTQALAQVTLPIVHAQAVAIQGLVARQLEFGANLHLSLRGIPAQAFVRFARPPTPYALDEANAELARARTDAELARLFGPAWAPQAQRRWDVADGDAARAPDWWAPGAGAAPPQETP